MLTDNVHYIDGATCTWAGKWSGKPSVAPPGNMSDHCQDYSRINHVRGRERILYFPFIFCCYYILYFKSQICDTSGTTQIMFVPLFRGEKKTMA